MENLARADIKAMEEARAFQAMLDRGWTVEKLAKDIGVQQARITARTALLNLDEAIQSLVDSNHFPLGHANYLVDLPKNDQVQIVKLFTTGKLKDGPASGLRRNLCATASTRAACSTMTAETSHRRTMSPP
ncbi:hypothetical protein FJ970_32450 (plasmid) [Mesorhizobium sp. B2-1-8]|uniref:ParB/RepB/Spo0J family partition protein n=1 Tax=Mesorhizobium sp. B2-1-8 TaxID=2589967 RepID=UPI0011287377|nr:hypothetical protein [Mesorhizobium sp. B2-1-8]UCI22645.1 hypothetical protein FJ970_32450 [Mesorhizobium sp. B2-1-8]